MAQDRIPFFSRLSFAFAAFFGILFDGAYAARLLRARELPAPGSEEAEAPDAAPAKEPPTETIAAPAHVAAPAKEHPAADDTPREENGALLLLSLLQREGRLIDFLEQDIAAFSDADVGAAARAVHEGARRALRAHAKIEPARAETEGARVTLEAGFDPAAVKLTGNVRGTPPHTGTLKHPGWRAKEMHLPRAVDGHDVHVLAPAEVEL